MIENSKHVTSQQYQDISWKTQLSPTALSVKKVRKEKCLMPSHHQPSPIVQKKKKVEATVTTPQEDSQENQFPTINGLDLVDWVPIENNADNFDLGEILKEIKENNTKPKVPVPVTTTVQTTNTSTKTPSYKILQVIGKCSNSLSSPECTSHIQMSLSTTTSASKFKDKN